MTATILDGTKIAANASIDANRGKDWFDRRVTGIVAESEDTDQAEDMTARAAGDVGSDRVPAGLGDRTRRAERIRQAAAELRAQLQRRARADEQREAAALARRRRSEDGTPVVGRIPDGPHRLPEARAHLAREIATHQDKLDRYAALIARLRAARGTDADAAWLQRELEHAAKQRTILAVEVAMPDGSARELVLEVTGFGGGRLRGRDVAGDVERTLPISSIRSTRPVGDAGS